MRISHSRTYSTRLRKPTTLCTRQRSTNVTKTQLETTPRVPPCSLSDVKVRIDPQTDHTNLHDLATATICRFARRPPKNAIPYANRTYASIARNLDIWHAIATAAKRKGITTDPRPVSLQRNRRNRPCQLLNLPSIL